MLQWLGCVNSTCCGCRSSSWACSFQRSLWSMSLNVILIHSAHIPPLHAYHPHISPLQWRHNERGGVPNHQSHDCLLKRLFRYRSTKTSKLRVTGLYAGNSPVNFSHKGPVTRKMVSFNDVIMTHTYHNREGWSWGINIVFVVLYQASVEQLVADYKR